MRYQEALRLVQRPDLAELAAKWQEKLRLRDWDVQLEYVAGLSRNGAAVHGLCYRIVDNRTALIQINDPDAAWEGAPDVEEIVVHELLHLMLAPLAGDTQAERAIEEQAVWALTPLITSPADRAVVARAMGVSPKAQRSARAMNEEEIQARLVKCEEAYKNLEARLTRLEGGESAPGPTTSAARAKRSAVAITAEERSRLDRAFGSNVTPIRRAAGSVTLGVMTSEQARAFIARGGAA